MGKITRRTSIPYIKANDGRREALRNGDTAQTAGELNYQIFFFVKHAQDILNKKLIEGFVKNFLGEKKSYQKYNDMTGALIRCYLEIQRRLNIDADILIEICSSYDDEIAKYEDIKRD